MTTVKIEIIQTVEQTIEYTFEVPDGYTLPADPADVLDALEADPAATFIGHDVVDESVISQQVPIVTDSGEV